MLKKNVLSRRMPAYATLCDRALKRIQSMPNVPLAYVSVYRRMNDIFHTLAYASTIRNSTAKNQILV
jgi:glyoxylate carboligase